MRPEQEEAFQTNACVAPGRRYISLDTERCAAIRFFCEQGLVPFSDTCGCGCEPAG